MSEENRSSNKPKAESGSWREVLAICTVVLLFVGAIFWSIYRTSPYYDIKEKLAIEARKSAEAPVSLLPPGITNMSLLPTPVWSEQHIGGEWIFARGQQTWSMVVYHPGDVSIKTVRRIPVDIFGNIATTNGPNDMIAFEIFAESGGSKSSPIRFKAEFLVKSLLPDTTVIFIGYTPESLAYLKSIRWAGTSRAK